MQSSLIYDLFFYKGFNFLDSSIMILDTKIIFLSKSIKIITNTGALTVCKRKGVWCYASASEYVLTKVDVVNNV